MNRRKSLKALVVGSFSSNILLEACKNKDVKLTESKVIPVSPRPDRMPVEIGKDKKILSETFFTAHEMTAITILSDIIIPKDAVSGSSSEANVPDFIEFIVKDKPEYQIPIRGGLRWLDLVCLRNYEHDFSNCDPTKQLEIIDKIAYPEKTNPGWHQGTAFFTLMRNLTISGFYTSEMGIKDLGYVGNRPNQWNGVPDEILNQYEIAYSEKELKESIRYDLVK